MAKEEEPPKADVPPLPDPDESERQLARALAREVIRWKQEGKPHRR